MSRDTKQHRRRRLLALSAALLVGALFPAATHAAIVSETVMLDTHEAANDGFAGPAQTSDVLANGAPYDITVSGTYSFWAIGNWASQSVCGTPEPAPQTPSPGVANGPVGLDADTLFADAGPGSCAGEQVPRHSVALQIEINSGSGYAHREPVGGPFTAPQPGHEYHYTVQGQGKAAGFRLRDNPTSDNYGVLTITVTRINRPPNCSAAGPSIAKLWPPNHKFKTVTVKNVTDPDGNPVTIVISGVTQDEPVNGLGDGDTAPDARNINGKKVDVRAERSGLGDGRVYRISFTATDNQGGSCSGSVNVGVPHDQGGQAVPIDSGQIYNSFGT
jgi:hypothetical protein